MPQTTSLIMTVVWSAAVLYLLSRIRHMEAEIRKLKKDRGETASVQDVFEIANQVVTEHQKKAMVMRAKMHAERESLRARTTTAPPAQASAAAPPRTSPDAPPDTKMKTNKDE